MYRGGGEEDEDECNCFGAGFDGECCRTCEDVRAAYRRKGWRFDASAVPSVRTMIRAFSLPDLTARC